MVEQRADAQQLKTFKDSKLSPAKGRLLEIVYQTVPEEGDLLRGSKKPTPVVAMDVDFDFKDYTPDEVKKKLAELPEKIILMREQLGLMLLERSAGKGFHIVFRRHLDMTQIENLQWASDLIGCKFDAAAKDLTRVFYTTGSEDILFIHPDLFLPNMNQAVEAKAETEAEEVQPELIEVPQATTELPEPPKLQ